MPRPGYRFDCAGQRGVSETTTVWVWGDPGSSLYTKKRTRYGHASRHKTAYFQPYRNGKEK